MPDHFSAARAWLKPLIVTLLLPAAALPVCAQGTKEPFPRSNLPLPFRAGPRREYDRIPFSGDYLERLTKASGREELEKLLARIKEDPSQFDVNDKRLKDLDLDNPLIRDLLEDYRQKYADKLKEFGKDLDPDTRQQLQDKLKAIEDVIQQKDLAPSQDGTPEGGKDPSRTPPPREGEDPATTGTPPSGEGAAEDHEDSLPRWAQDWMKGVEGSRLGRLLSRSPAFQQGMLDLQQAMRERGGGATFRGGDLEKLTSRFRLPDGWDGLRLEDRWAKLPDMPFPHLPLPRFALPATGSWNPPAAGGAPPLQVLLWLLVLAALGFLLWQLLARAAWRIGPPGGGEYRLGPWPIDPAQVATRGDLIRAFEYLSLLLLGPEARVWNHRAIAARLTGGDAERHRAADQLATLYEQARYAPSEEPLPTEALAAARRDLCFLAGVANG